jgi:hypothetical protein
MQNAEATNPIVRASFIRVEYQSAAGDWRLVISNDVFEILPIATGGLEYASGVNLDNLAALIVAAKADAIERGINWQGV